MSTVTRSSTRRTSSSTSSSVAITNCTSSVLASPQRSQATDKKHKLVQNQSPALKEEARSKTRAKRRELESELANKKRRINESLMKVWQEDEDKKEGKGKGEDDKNKIKNIVIAEDDFYLNNHFKDNEKVKALGAKFDGAKKKWYIPIGLNAVPFKRWLPKQISIPVVERSGDIAQENTFIYCSIKQKNEAKALGAKFDGNKRQWYIPKGEDMTKFDKWRTPPTYIYCPIHEKDQAKRLGAEYDPIRRQWYVPHGEDLKKFAKWRTPRYIQCTHLMNMFFPDFAEGDQEVN